MTPNRTLWYNANIMNPDRPNTVYEAMLTDENGDIAWLGPTQDALRFFPEAARQDLDGYYVLPGLIDSHTHYELLGQSLVELNVTGLTRQETLDAVAKRAAALPPGTWIAGAQGWDNMLWDDSSQPTRAELDAVAPDHPVLLPRIDGHVSWFNTRALAAAELEENAPDPPHGEFSRDAAGRLTGLASERAAELFRDAIPPRAPEAWRELVLAVQEHLLSHGITAVSDAYTTLPLIRALEALDAAGELKLNTFGNLAVIEERGKDREAWEELLRRRRDGAFTARVRLPGVKFFLDGSVGARTAVFEEPYADRPETRGELLYEPEELRKHFQWAKDEGLQVMVHAIGDRAAAVALDAMAAVLTDPEDSGLRWRLEHFQHADADLMDLAGYLGVIPSLQPLQEVGDRALLPERLGPERAGRAHRLRSFKRYTKHVVINSDAPVDSANPWLTIAAATARGDGEALTAREALTAYTREAAYALGTQRERGTLDIGKRADFIVLADDPFREGAKLAEMSVLRTVSGGEIVHEA